MGILFLTTQNSLHKQDENLLVSLKMQDFPMVFACLENSLTASFASSQSIHFFELTENSLAQFFRLKKCIKEEKITHIHVFDEKALRLALWLKKCFLFLKIVGSWHERTLTGGEPSIKKDNPYLYALVRNKFDFFFCTSPELNYFLGKSNMQQKIGLLPFVPVLKQTRSCLLKPEEKETYLFFVHSYCEQETDRQIAFEAFLNVLAERENICLVMCFEKEGWVQSSLEYAQEQMLASKCVFIDKEFFETFYPLADCVLCCSTDGEGDYPMLFQAWAEEKVLIASDLSVHTKFVLADSNACALLYPRDDAAALSKCMLKAMQEKELCAELRRNGKNKVKNNVIGQIAQSYLAKLNLK